MAEPLDDATNSENTSNPAGQGQPVPPEPSAPGQGGTPPDAAPRDAVAGPPQQPAGPEPAGGTPADAQPPVGEPAGQPAAAGESHATPAEPLGQPGDAIAGGEPSPPAEPPVPAEPAASVDSVEPAESPGGALATTGEDQGRQYDGADPHQYAGGEDNYDHGQYGSAQSGTAERWQHREQQEDQEDQPDDEEDEEEDDGQKKMTLVEHLEELRTRIIRAAIGLAIGAGISLAFGEWIFRILNEPINKVLGPGSLITTTMTDPFTMYMKVCLYFGLVISAPWVFYQIWMFISAGLYPNERKYVTRSVPFSAALFILGAIFFLKVIAVPFLTFLKYWNSKVMGLTMMPTQQSHLDFMTDMMVIFGLCFQLPVAILILAKVGLITLKTLNHYRRHAVVGILVVSAFLSPSPSPLDQMALAIPMYCLYELGVVLTYFLVERKRRKEEAAEAAEEAAELAAAGGGTAADEEPADAEYEYVDEPEAAKPPDRPKRTE